MAEARTLEVGCGVDGGTVSFTDLRGDVSFRYEAIRIMAGFLMVTVCL